MRRFFVLLWGVTFVAQLPVAVAAGTLAVARGADAWLAWLGAAALGLATTAAFRGRVQLARHDRPISTARRLLIEEPYFVHWCAALMGLPFSVVVVPLLLLLGQPLWLAAGASYLALLPVAFWGVVIRRRWLRVREIEVPIAGLGAAFDGYRIAQLSDLHVGSHCPEARVRRWVEEVNALGVDLVALTGDYVTSGVRFHEQIARPLGALTPRDAVIAVMGNHDYFGEGEPLMSLLRARGVELLRNEHRVIERGDDALCIVGVDDIYTRRIDIERTMAARPEGLPVVALAHDPKSFPELARRGAQLVLSGHTHWGQVGLPWLGHRYNYAATVYRYHAGRYQADGATLYVHPGLGTTGPPVRLGTWPEIAVITLRAA
jgi:uncharacterized protein